MQGTCATEEEEDINDKEAADVKNAKKILKIRRIARKKCKVESLSSHELDRFILDAIMKEKVEISIEITNKIIENHDSVKPSNLQHRSKDEIYARRESEMI